MICSKAKVTIKGVSPSRQEATKNKKASSFEHTSTTTLDKYNLVDKI